MGFEYLFVSDGEDIDVLYKTIKKAQKRYKPSFIEIKTKIGHGSSLEGSNKVHGNPLPSEEVKKFRSEIGGEAFTVKDEVYQASFILYVPVFSARSTAGASVGNTARDILPADQAACFCQRFRGSGKYGYRRCFRHAFRKKRMVLYYSAACVFRSGKFFVQLSAYDGVQAFPHGKAVGAHAAQQRESRARSSYAVGCAYHGYAYGV